MRDYCPICHRDITQQIPDSRYPELCKNCADVETKLHMGKRGTHPDQQTLF